jgi:hypothetical protein
MTNTPTIDRALRAIFEPAYARVRSAASTDRLLDIEWWLRHYLECHSDHMLSSFDRAIVALERRVSDEPERAFCRTMPIDYLIAVISEWLPLGWLSGGTVTRRQQIDLLEQLLDWCVPGARTDDEDCGPHCAVFRALAAIDAAREELRDPKAVASAMRAARKRATARSH